jgi:hypothetical protein
MRTTYFQVDDKFYEQKEGMAMESPLSPVVNNIFVENFEQLALTTEQQKPKMRLRYVDDTFVIWPHGPVWLQEFLDHLNNLGPSIQFTMETECNNTLPFLDVLITRRESSLITTDYKKTYTHWLISSLSVQSSTTCEARNCSEFIQQGSR